AGVKLVVEERTTEYGMLPRVRVAPAERCHRRALAEDRRARPAAVVDRVCSRRRGRARGAPFLRVRSSGARLLTLRDTSATITASGAACRRGSGTWGASRPRARR